MKARPVLTIAIPTYDRNDLLVRNLPPLLDQLTPDVQLLIIDNASPTPVSDSLGPLPDGARLVRNAVNLGGNANILRCLELCETPWVMIMGDDDQALPGMITCILGDISAYAEAIVLHYSTPNLHVRKQDWTTQGRTEFLSRLDSFPNLLFISSSVMHIARMKEGFSWGHHFAYSCAPHLALLLSAMGPTSVVAFRTASLADRILPEIENRGSVFRVAFGLPTLLELSLTPTERWLLGRHLAGIPTWQSLLHQALLAALFSGRTRIEVLRQYLHALHRLPFFYAPIRRLLGWYVAPLILIPRVSYAILGRISSARTGRRMGRHNLPLERL